MTNQKLDESAIKSMFKEPTKTEASQKLVEKKTKLVAVNEMRKQAGIEGTVDKPDDLTVRDKRGWLVLQDYWNGHITKERADEMLRVVYAN